MSITYNYEIIAVDQAARCMEVVYTSEGRQTMHIGARLPYEGEELEAVIAMYSPVVYWLEQERAIQVPQVGTSGTIVPSPMPSEEPAVASAQPTVEGAQTL